MDRDVRVKLAADVDTQSVSRAANALDGISISAKGVSLSASELSADLIALNPQLAQLAAQENQATAATQRLADTQMLAADASRQSAAALANQRAPLQNLTALYAGLEEQEKRAAQAGASVSSTANMNIKSGYTGTLRAAGAAVANIGGGQSATQAASLLGLAELGPVALGIGAVSLALRAIQADSQKATDALQANADAYTDVREAALKSTRADFEQQLRDAQQLEQVRKQAFQDATDELLDYVNSNPQFTYPVTGIAMEWVSGMGGQFGFLQGNAEKAKLALADTTSTIGALETALDDNSTAAADAIAAEERLADLRERIADAATGIQQSELDAAIRAQSMTQEQRAERVREIEQEIASRDAYRESHVLTEEALQANAVAVDKLRNESVELTAVEITRADVLERQKEAQDALVDQSDALQEGIENVRSAEEDLREQTEKTAEIRRKLIDIEAEAQQKSRELAQDTDQKVLDAQADASEKRQQIEADGAERRQKIEQDDADRRAEILDRFNTDYNNAVAEGDAVAAHKAEQTRDDELAKQDKARDKALSELEQQMAKQYAAVDKALDKQLSNIQRQFERQQTTIDDAYNKQYRNLTQSLNESLQAEEFANNRLEALRSDNAFRAQYWAGVVETANKRYADSAAALAVSLHQSASLIASLAGAGASAIGSAFPPLSDANGNIIGGGGGGGIGIGAMSMSYAANRMNLDTVDLSKFWRMADGAPPRGYFPPMRSPSGVNTYGGGSSSVVVNVPVTLQGSTLRMNDVLREVGRELKASAKRAGLTVQE